jgi:hypothetical protein
MDASFNRPYADGLSPTPHYKGRNNLRQRSCWGVFGVAPGRCLPRGASVPPDPGRFISPKLQAFEPVQVRSLVGVVAGRLSGLALSRFPEDALSGPVRLEYKAPDPLVAVQVLDRVAEVLLGVGALCRMDRPG